MSSRETFIDPENWASLKPFGLGEEKPNNYREIARAVNANRGRLRSEPVTTPGA